MFGALRVGYTLINVNPHYTARELAYQFTDTGAEVIVVLVQVVNPAELPWTMELVLPRGRLAALCLAMVAAGTLTVWLAARGAATQQVALAVKEDW